MAEEPAGTGHVWHRAAAASPHRASCLHMDMHTRHDFTRNTCTFSQKVKKKEQVTGKHKVHNLFLWELSLGKKRFF